jgi:hypothetical protein
MMSTSEKTLDACATRETGRKRSVVITVTVWQRLISRFWFLLDRPLAADKAADKRRSSVRQQTNNRAKMASP